MKLKLIILFLFSLSFLTGCVTPSGKTYAQSSSMLRPGDYEQKVIKTLGSPSASEVAGRDKVLKFCGTGFFADDMVYVWIQDGRVKSVTNDTNTRGGTCSRFFKSVNWASTTQSGYLYLNELSPRATRTSSNNAIYDALQNSQQQNNQIYNSLIESMGRQQQSLQPQRFQTNCMMIGNMMSCN